MCCDVLSFNIYNGYGFDYVEYDNGVGFGDEYGDFRCEGVICGFDLCVMRYLILCTGWYVDLWLSLS